MDFTRAELKAQAKEQLKGKIWKIFGITIAASLIAGGASGILSMIFPLLGTLAQYFIGAPLSLGVTMLYLEITYGDEPNMSTIFQPFKTCYLKSVALFFLVGLFTLLWSLLFIIPGIIMGLAYSQSFLILAENPEMSPMDCIRASKAMMNGHKMDLFVLQLSFIGWCLLAMVTLGIAYIYVIPYMQLTVTNFYHRIKGNSDYVDAADVIANTTV